MVFFRVGTTKDLPCGASTGCILIGTGQHNRGLRVQLLHDQQPGHGGPLEGDFVLLDAGDNKHSAALLPVVGQVTTAAALLALIRRKHPGCVSVVNGHSLAVEGDRTTAHARRPRFGAGARFDDEPLQ